MKDHPSKLLFPLYSIIYFIFQVSRTLEVSWLRTSKEWRRILAWCRKTKKHLVQRKRRQVGFKKMKIKVKLNFYKGEREDSKHQDELRAVQVGLHHRGPDGLFEKPGQDYLQNH